LRDSFLIHKHQWHTNELTVAHNFIANSTYAVFFPIGCINQYGRVIDGYGAMGE